MDFHQITANQINRLKIRRRHTADVAKKETIEEEILTSLELQDANSDLFTKL